MSVLLTLLRFLLLLSMSSILMNILCTVEKNLYSAILRWNILYIIHIWSNWCNVSFKAQLSSIVQSCLTLCHPMDCSMPGHPVHHQLQEFTQTHDTESVVPSNHLIFCRPLLPPPLIFPRIRVFSTESVLRIRWPTYWSFSFSLSPSNEYSGLISFRMDWLDLLAVQGTLKSLLQHHS